jgi:hypothetical protein
MSNFFGHDIALAVAMNLLLRLERLIHINLTLETTRTRGVVLNIS